jgi:hypothetical protein
MSWCAQCVYMQVCMHVCMRVCMHACMHVCMRAYMHVCMHVCIDVKVILSLVVRSSEIIRANYCIKTIKHIAYRIVHKMGLQQINLLTNPPSSRYMIRALDD